MEIWFQDEARLGQKNGLTRLWARKGTAPVPADQRYRRLSVRRHLSGSRQGGGATLPWADAQAMQMHLDEISRHVARKAHAVVLMDRAGWHTTGKLKVPKNLTIILLPSRAPELNPNLRANWLSNRVFEDTMPPMLDAKLEQAHRTARNHHINRRITCSKTGSAVLARATSELLERHWSERQWRTVMSKAQSVMADGTSWCRCRASTVSMT